MKEQDNCRVLLLENPRHPHQQLSEIVVIRPLLVVLLVFYHAFAIYGGEGAWEPIEGFPKVYAYWWLDRLSYAFMLEMFVFISGYVFGYQVRTRGENKLMGRSLLPSKIKRLILPCMIFSLLYILLYGDITQPIYRTLYGLINGVAHMWFLPMLFWCFVAVWLFEKVNLGIKAGVLLTILASLVSVNGLPLQLSHTMYYLLFFYVGYVVQRYDIDLRKFYTKRVAIISLFVFIVLFVVGTLIKDYLDDMFNSPQFVIQLTKFIIGKTCTILYSSAGIAMLMIVVGYIQKKKDGKEKERWLIEIGNLCFGVYLFQQFILHALYYNTELPVVLGPYWLPWVGFVIALFSSLIIAWLLRKTKIGKSII